MSVPNYNTLGYTGLKEKDPPNIRYFRKDPTSADISGFDIGDFWINIDVPQSWQLMAKSGGVADWRLMGGATSGIFSLTPDVGAPITAVAGDIDIIGTNGIFTQNLGAGVLRINNTFNISADGGPGVPFVNGNIDFIAGQDIAITPIGPNQIQFDNTVSGFGWVIVTSADNPVTLAPDTGYITKGAVPVQFILPAVAAVGDHFSIAGNSNLWTIAQNAAQTITLLDSQTTPGVLGSLTATRNRDSIEVVCVTANLDFQIVDCVGNLTFA